jgi:hypothetical protein
MAAVTRAARFTDERRLWKWTTILRKYFRLETFGRGAGEVGRPAPNRRSKWARQGDPRPTRTPSGQALFRRSPEHSVGLCPEGRKDRAALETGRRLIERLNVPIEGGLFLAAAP